MTDSNYQAMTNEELRDCVRYYPKDVEAFHILMDRLEQRPKVIFTTDEEIEAELKKRINQSRSQ
ncbi:DUF6887 family protein [Nostoc sp.]|uniref:DUF6887 family protein n=1 Tax=Nostoc sp. TaxID=1180 RepID=UPI002FFA3640